MDACVANEDVVVGDDEGRMGGMIVSSSSLSSPTSTSEAMMVNEIDEYDDETTVKSILTNYLQNIDLRARGAREYGRTREPKSTNHAGQLNIYYTTTKYL